MEKSSRFVVVMVAVGFVLSAGCATSSKPKSTVAIKPSDIHKSLDRLDKRKPFAVTRHKIELEKTGVQKYDDFLTEAAAVKGSVVVTNVVLEDIEVAMNQLTSPPAAAPPAAAAAAATPAATPATADATPATADAAATPATTTPATAPAATAKKDDDDLVPEKAPTPVGDYDLLANTVAKRRGSLDPTVVDRIHTDVQMLDALVNIMKDLPARAQDVTAKGQGLAQAATAELTKDPLAMAPVPGAIAAALSTVAAAAADAPGTVTRSGQVIKALAICGCGNASKTLTPGDISPALAPLFDKNPFADADTKVDYVVTDVADYDSFFKEVAVLRGEAVMVDVWVKGVGATLASITNTPIPTTPAEVQKLANSLHSKKTKPNGDVVARLKNHVAQLTTMMTVFAQTPAKLTELTGKAKAIPGNVATDAVKAPAAMAGVPGAVEESAKQVVESGKKVGDVIPTLQKLVAPLTALAGA